MFYFGKEGPWEIKDDYEKQDEVKNTQVQFQKAFKEKRHVSQDQQYKCLRNTVFQIY